MDTVFSYSRHRRRRRGIVALVAALLLLGPTAAQACAWILWQAHTSYAPDGSPWKTDWRITEAAESLATCRELEERMDAWAKRTDKPWQAGRTNVRLTYLCLPDTFNPTR